MIIKTEQVRLVISNKALPTKQLSEIIGISQKVLDEYREGSLSFDDLSAGVLMTIQKWIDDGNYTFSYDYSEFIEDLEADIAEGLTDDFIFIVRGEYNEALDKCPIVDYYYSQDEIEEGDMAEKLGVEAVLNEMKQDNSIL
jgi:hypothetical protein